MHQKDCKRGTVEKVWTITDAAVAVDTFSAMAAHSLAIAHLAACTTDTIGEEFAGDLRGCVRRQRASRVDNI